jgi:hypothetical protein
MCRYTSVIGSKGRFQREYDSDRLSHPDLWENVPEDEDCKIQEAHEQ